MRRVLRWLSTPYGLVALLVVGLIVRLLVADMTGATTETHLHARWANRLANRGPWRFYPSGEETFLVDYPPGYLYVIWLLRSFAENALSPFVLKLPAIAGDLGLAFFASRLAGRISEDETMPAVAASMILFNPALFFVSAVVGRIDSLAVAVVAAACLLLTTGPPTFRRAGAAVALCAVAVLTVPQTAFAMPFLALVFFWRDVIKKPEGRVRTVLGATAVGAAVSFAMTIPFRLAPLDVYPFFRETASTFPPRKVFAFNLWGSFGLGRPGIGENGVYVLGVPAVVIGTIAFVLVVVYVRILLWRTFEEGLRPAPHVLAAAVATLCVGYALLTDFHARTLYPAVALLAALAGYRVLRWAAVGLSAVFLVELVYGYVYRPGAERIRFFGSALGRTIYGTSTISPQIRVLCVVTTVVALGVALLAIRELGRADVRRRTA